MAVMIFDYGLGSVLCTMDVVGLSYFFFSSRRRHTRFDCDWSSDVCSSDLELGWATRIVVAQRVGTIMKADRILVMDAGRIVGRGTHAELLASSETYQEDRKSVV